MNRVEHCIRRARRRVILGRFGRGLAVASFSGLVIAAMAILYRAFWGVPSIETMEATGWNWGWNWNWIAGSQAAALVASAIYSILGVPTKLQTAVEIDQRFGLRERLASAIGMPSKDQDSDFGRALVADADKTAADISIAERFELRPRRLAMLPLAMLPMVVAMAIFIQPAQTSLAAVGREVDPAEVRQIKVVAKQLKKRIADQKKEAEAKGLTEAKDLFAKMESKLDDLSARKGLDQKQAMIELNDLKKQLEQRREQLGSSEEMRKMMSRMNSMSAGPGEKIVKSIAKGDFGKAEEMVRQLAEKMAKGELSEDEKKQLQKQAKQMADAMKKVTQKHEQEKKELQRQIEQAKKDGKSGQADQLQQKMNQLQQKDSQMQKMQQMAESMQQSSDAMQQGDASEAAESLQQMADQLGEMQSEMDQLQDLESAMGDLSQGKQQMRCQGCRGGGCQQCQGNGEGDKPGQGQGRGAGQGDREEAQDDTNTYKTQVRGNVKKGRAVITGYADGPNRKGVTREAVKEAIQSAIREEADPSENQVLPRTERQHAQEYFDQLRKR